MKRLLHAFLIVLFGSQLALAQNTVTSSCAQNLRLAQATYESGRLHEVPGYIDKCFTGSATQQEKVSAYRLLCLTYLYLEEPAKADDAMLHLLRTFHEFEPSKADPAEFVALWKTFRRDPLYRLGGKIGVNATVPNVISYVPANDGKSEYLLGVGFQGGATFELPLTKFREGLTFASELNFVLKNFRYENNVTYIDQGDGSSRTFALSSTENQAWLSIPLAIQYEVFQKKFKEKKLKPFVSLGVSPDLLISANNTFLRTKEGASSLEEETVAVKGQRNTINLNAIASVGTKLKVSGGLAVFELRYSHGLTKANNVEDVYAMQDKMLPSGYVDGIFKLNSLSLTVGYVYNIYKPKKLNK